MAMVLARPAGLPAVWEGRGAPHLCPSPWACCSPAPGPQPPPSPYDPLARPAGLPTVWEGGEPPPVPQPMGLLFSCARLPTPTQPV